jgi:UDP:flavonoid glycosyltransferase YjiC (YdhE family)
MRILVTACPMYGHVNPMLSLALAAQRAGHEVVVASGPDMASHIERSGLTAWPVGPTHEQAGGVTHSMVVPLGHDIDWLTYFEISGDQRAVDLLDRVDQWRPDLVISELLEVGGWIVASKIGARLVVHCLMRMSEPEILQPYEKLLGRLADKWGIANEADGFLSSTNLEPCPPALRSGRHWPHAIPIRPELPPPITGDGSLTWFDALPHANTVLLTLGTVYHGNQGVLQTALEDLRDLPVNVLVASGPGADPGRFGPQPTNVRIEPVFPYAAVMPRCRVIVSQGGTGVTLLGLAHGLPQLVLPQGADQLDYGLSIAQIGAGLVLTPEAIVPGGVAAAVTRLLAEASFAAAAETVRAEIEAMPDADAVVAILTGTGPAPVV